jgi:biopolymer transport protein ExbD
MAMTVTSAGGEADLMIEMNTTPLIDVMLVLVVMLIVTIPMQTHAIKLDMPTGNPPAAAAPPPEIDIDIDFDGTFYWNNELVADRSALDAKLAAAADLPDPPEIHLNPNRLVTYHYVAQVLASAQRLGLKKIGIVGGSGVADRS